MKSPTTLPVALLAVCGAAALAFVAGRASTASLTATPGAAASSAEARLVAAFFQPERDDPVGALSPEIQAMLDAGKPGPEHEILERMLGDWSADIRGIMPDGSEMRNTAALTGVSMFEGRFVGQEMSGQMMGLPFEGYALYAYSRPTGEYQAIWFDSMSTHIYMSRGQYDAENDMLVLHGKEPNPADPTQILD